MKNLTGKAAWRQSANLLRMLAHPRHRSIIDALADGEQAFGHIAASTGLSEAITSLYIKKLRDYDFLASRRLGSRIFYRVCDPLVLRLLQDLRHESVIG